jgi:2',3'-cyclic-nucleotide 2'-phosphodiesterase (5'-nucleotidase family)
MMADAVMEMANPIFENRTGNKIDAVILNYGGIRSGINAGDISTRTAYNIMPFENEVAVAAFSSEELRALINYLAKNKTAHPIAGLQVILNADGDLHEAKVNGEQIQNKTYYVATSDYLIKGGDRMDFFLNAEKVETLDYKLRNLFIDYFKKKDTIAPVRDERFIQLQN